MLLILAGVSIATLTGDNGLLTKASEAKEETRGASVEETKELWLIENMGVQYLEETTRTLEDVLKELQDRKLLTEDEANEVRYTGSVTIGSRTIVFENIEPGLYDCNTGKLLKTWQQLKEEEFSYTSWDGKIVTHNSIEVEDGILKLVNWNLEGKIVISDEVTEIASYAFDCPENITEVIIPNTVKIIRYEAFCNCTALKEIRIPASVELIESSAIDVCYALEKIAVSEKNQYYSSVDGILYSKDKTVLVKVPENIQMEQFIVSNDVKTIKEYAFDNVANITLITISNNIVNIEDNAFSDMSATVVIDKEKDFIEGAPWGLKSPGKIVWLNGEETTGK